MPDSVTVALIDDHQFVRQVVGAWLAVQGATIDVVASVATVGELRLTPGWGAHVALLALDLGDGSTVEENVAALVAAGSKVAVVSASAEPPVVRRALRAGALGYVPKSGSAEDVLGAILAAAAGEAFMTATLAVGLLGDHPASRPQLSRQELRTLRWYAGGMAMKSVALRLGVSEGCVKSYVDRIREKYEKAGREAPTKVDLYKRAIEDGYLSAR